VFERLDQPARRVLEIAQQQARDLRHNYLGTEHVLLALALAGGAPGELLTEHGCGAAEVRADILGLIGRGRPQPRPPDELLASLGIDLGEVRRRVEAAFGPEAISRAALRTRPRRRRWPGHQWWPGCDQGAPHNSALLGGRWFGLAPRLKRVLEIASDTAAPSPASPAHLLLGILDEGEGVACQVLARRNVDLNALATATRAQLR
jgi:ATP-dependent Clp protease ATP-binding subunit ClpA